MYFCYFELSPIGKVCGPSFEKKLNLLHPRIFCAKFGRNWLSGSGEEGENVKCLRTDGRTEDGSKAIRKARLTFQLK